MKPLQAFVAISAALLLGSCEQASDRPTLVIQRFFGECGAVYGTSIDVAKAETECGIITTILNRFVAENPDINVKINVVAWPGYPQLAAQIAAGDPPDLVTMHQSVISDYQARGLLSPMADLLADAQVNPESFTLAGQRGAIKRGQYYALPWDTIGRLWHINTRLMDQAGLMADGKPILPNSPTQLLEHARRFKAATGKPYLIQAQVAAPDYLVANLYTYLMAQDAVIFPDNRHIRLNTPEARAVVQLYRTLNAEKLTTVAQDFPGATASFVNGEGGVFPTGTWMIGPYDEAAKQPTARLGGYAVVPFPRLWGKSAAFVDGHAWVVPKDNRPESERKAIARFLGFVAKYNGDWVRTGHLPAFGAVLDAPTFKTQPHRSDIAAMAATGQQLPDFVERQSAIQGLIGEELEAAVTGIKPIDVALMDAERRVNELLAQLP
ncbi:ABC transporter substrate-binding protein [Sphingorhabdus sp.]|uniref:ABC transporter substrate-binding protein n=1 Tax=Sphingorhabdus sp. TaxID=1902408 RepID=UPI00391D909D